MISTSISASLFICVLVSMSSPSHLAQVCILLEPLRPALVVKLRQVVLGVWVMTSMQSKGWMAVGWRLWTCSLQGSVGGQGDHTFPSGQMRLLLQRNGAQTMNCREEERERSLLIKMRADRRRGGRKGNSDMIMLFTFTPEFLLAELHHSQVPSRGHPCALYNIQANEI